MISTSVTFCVWCLIVMLDARNFFLINHSLKQPSGEAKEKVKNIDLYIPPLNLTHHCEMKP